ncbi:MAG: hypothetical protein QXU09_05350, partial [Thermoproteota archaeon]
EQTPDERAQMWHVIRIRPGAADQNFLGEGGSPFRRAQSITDKTCLGKVQPKSSLKQAVIAQEPRCNIDKIVGILYNKPKD